MTQTGSHLRGIRASSLWIHRVQGPGRDGNVCEYISESVNVYMMATESPCNLCANYHWSLQGPMRLVLWYLHFMVVYYSFLFYYEIQFCPSFVPQTLEGRSLFVPFCPLGTHVTILNFVKMLCMKCLTFALKSDFTTKHIFDRKFKFFAFNI